jgi:hypothetical protein
MAQLRSRLKALLGDAAIRWALAIFVVMRCFLSLWAILSLAINPLPEEPDEVLRPYLGEPRLDEGISGLLLGPWQRFDTQRYLNVAQYGYVDEQNSVFPPLYPLAIRVLGRLLSGESDSNLLAAILLSNLALIGFLMLFHRVVSAEVDADAAGRTLIYLVLFPTGFFLFAPYSEPIFMLFALGSLWTARQGRFWTAGILGLLASLTRLTGWILVVPLAYEYWKQVVQHQGTRAGPENNLDKGRIQNNTVSATLEPTLLAVTLPALALGGFVLWRWQFGLPSLGTIYEQYWYQKTGLPGVDLISAVGSLFFGGAPRNNELIALALDFSTTVLLISSTAIAFRRLGKTYGLYSAMLLFFMLLPTSEVKPLYSFSRYTLAFFPTFMLMGLAGKRASVNRLILYPSLLLLLYFSGQYFVWGWVA